MTAGPAKRAGQRLRELMQGSPPPVLPLISDALAALICEREGFDAVFLGGHRVSAVLFGRPEGFISTKENIDHAGNVAAAVGIPVLSDVEIPATTTGLQRAIREMDQRGVAGAQLDDHPSSVDSWPIERACDMYKAAADARRDGSFVIMARSDILHLDPTNSTEAVDRANRYLEAGADVIFIAATRNYELVPKVRGPVARVFGTPRGADDPGTTLADLDHAGYKLLIGGIATSAQVYLKAYQRVARTLKQTWSNRPVWDLDLQTPDPEFAEFLRER